jgi:hypothetical protein
MTRQTEAARRPRAGDQRVSQFGRLVVQAFRLHHKSGRHLPFSHFALRAVVHTAHGFQGSVGLWGLTQVNPTIVGEPWAEA